MSFRRKKPAWATTGPSAEDSEDGGNSSSEEQLSLDSATQHAKQGDHSNAKSANAADSSEPVDALSHLTHEDALSHLTHVESSHDNVSHTLGADSAAHVAVATAMAHSSRKHISGVGGSRAAHTRPKSATTPRQGSLAKAKGSSANSPRGDTNLKSGPSQMTFEEMLQRFQEPTLGSILRETYIADDSARKLAEKAAKADDDALPPFITTSSSPQSTSRQHASLNTTGSRTRPSSAAPSMSSQRFESELHAMHAETGEAQYTVRIMAVPHQVGLPDQARAYQC